MTPPVCLAAYSAAGIAGSKPMETGFAAWKLAKGLYIIPLLFAYSPLLFEGPLVEVIWAAVSGTLGLLAFTVAMEGYLLRPLRIWEQGIWGAAALALLWPNHWSKMAGFVAICSLYAVQRLAQHRSPAG